MSYRTSVNGTQIFGNNDFFDEWFDFIKSQGIEVDADGCYHGEITDVMGMFEAVDKITKGLIKKNHEKALKGEVKAELGDFSNWGNEDKYAILHINQEIIENAYFFLPYQVYLAVEDVVERNSDWYVSENGTHYPFCTYKLKEGEKIEVLAG